MSRGLTVEQVKADNLRRHQEAKLLKRQNRVLSALLSRWDSGDSSKYFNLEPNDLRRIAVDMIMRAEDGARI